MDILAKTCQLKLIVFALAVALVTLPGIVAAGDGGCVTCHAGPMALNTMLTERIENHPDVGPMVNTVPTDCAMCHAKGTEMGLMAPVHAKHEAVSCDNCHEVDEAGTPTGAKTGAKNW